MFLCREIRSWFLPVAAAVVVCHVSCADAAIIYNFGLAEAGANFGTSPDRTAPPSTLTPKGFYDFRNLPSTASANLNKGWGAVSYRISGGANPEITASGSSSAGYNGAYGAGGYIFGQGFADFSVSLTLTSAYSYVGSFSTTGSSGSVSGVTNGTGFLLPGSYTITASSLGGPVNYPPPAYGLSAGSDGFYLDLKLAPFTPPTCAALLANSVSWSLGGQSASLTGGATKISAAFTPTYNGQPVGLAAAASLCGVQSFTWQQTILHMPDPIPQNLADLGAIAVPPAAPFNDPPGQNTYYTSSEVSSGCARGIEANGILQTCLEPVTSADGNTLNYFDAPADACLFGGLGGLTDLCAYQWAPPGDFLLFETKLAGVSASGGVVQLPEANTLTKFWKDDFNGTAGGVSTLAVHTDVDTGSGTGGITYASDPIPEPTTIGLLVSALAGFSLLARPGRRSSSVTEIGQQRPG